LIEIVFFQDLYFGLSATFSQTVEMLFKTKKTNKKKVFKFNYRIKTIQ